MRVFIDLGGSAADVEADPDPDADVDPPSQMLALSPAAIHD